MTKVTPPPAQPLLLTKQVATLPWEIPEKTPQYRGSHHIGIMWEWHNHRRRWCFVYRLDGRPLFKKWYDEVRHFVNGYAAVREKDKWHFITEEGKIACHHRFYEVTSVDDQGCTKVQHPKHKHEHTNQLEWVRYQLPKRFFPQDATSPRT